VRGADGRRPGKAQQPGYSRSARIFGWAAWGLNNYDLSIKSARKSCCRVGENNLPCGRGSIYYVLGGLPLTPERFPPRADLPGLCDQVASPEEYLSLQGLGILAGREGKPERAARLFGAVDGLSPWLANVAPSANGCSQDSALPYPGSLEGLIPSASRVAQRLFVLAFAQPAKPHLPAKGFSPSTAPNSRAARSGFPSRPANIPSPAGFRYSSGCDLVGITQVGPRAEEIALCQGNPPQT